MNVSDIDHLERLAIEAIWEIQRRHRAELEPLVKKLVDIRSMRLLPPVVIPYDEAPAWLLRQLNVG